LIGNGFECYYVHGNNEYFHQRDKEIEDFLSGIAIQLLTNCSCLCGDQSLRIVGVDDARQGLPDTEQAFAEAREGEVVVVISHSPQIYKRIIQEERRFDLLLCGHTHGGQICLPGGMPLMIDSPGVPLRFGRGMHRLGDGYILVNRGLGEHFVNIRVFCPPELAVVNFC